MRSGASDTLYHARSLSTEEVLDLYRQQIQEEMYPYKGDTSDPFGNQFDRLIEENEQAVAIAQALYEQYGEHGAQYYMYAHENELVSGIGKALITGEYACLAI